MRTFDAVKLLRKYSKCPECGNEAVGDGEGTVEIEDNTFKRSCKCGWKVEIGEEAK